MLMPRRPVPALSVPTLTHGGYLLTSETPQNFTLVVFYRGLHCPICLKYLLELARLQPGLLLVPIDVQVELDDRRAFVDQHPLEVADVLEALRPDLPR